MAAVVAPLAFFGQMMGLSATDALNRKEHRDHKEFSQQWRTRLPGRIGGHTENEDEDEQEDDFPRPGTRNLVKIVMLWFSGLNFAK